MTLTLDTLVDRIRAASTLEELTQLVGPSDDDLVAERLRAMAIEQLRRHHGPDKASWPDHAQESYRLMCEQQADHERRYGRRVASWG